MKKRSWALRFTFRGMLVGVALFAIFFAVFSIGFRAEKKLEADLTKRFALVSADWAAPTWTKSTRMDLDNTALARVESLTIVDGAVTSDDLEMALRGFQSLKQLIVISTVLTADESRALQKKYPAVELNTLDTPETWDSPSVEGIKSMVVVCPIVVVNTDEDPSDDTAPFDDAINDEPSNVGDPFDTVPSNEQPSDDDPFDDNPFDDNPSKTQPESNVKILMTVNGDVSKRRRRNRCVASICDSPHVILPCELRRTRVISRGLLSFQVLIATFCERPDRSMVLQTESLMFRSTIRR
jgi:hypothetical protein